MDLEGILIIGPINQPKNQSDPASNRRQEDCESEGEEERH